MGFMNDESTKVILYISLLISVIIVAMLLSTGYLLHSKRLEGFGGTELQNEYYDAHGYVLPLRGESRLRAIGVAPMNEYGTEEHPYDSIDVVPMRQRHSDTQVAPSPPSRPPPRVRPESPLTSDTDMVSGDSSGGTLGDFQNTLGGTQAVSQGTSGGTQADSQGTSGGTQADSQGTSGGTQVDSQGTSGGSQADSQGSSGGTRADTTDTPDDQNEDVSGVAQGE